MKENWIIQDEHKTQMSTFMKDFWALIKASYEMPAETSMEHDHYWRTLVNWCNALMEKYSDNQTIIKMVMGYLDGQSARALDQKVEQMTAEDYIKEMAADFEKKG